MLLLVHSTQITVSRFNRWCKKLQSKHAAVPTFSWCLSPATADPNIFGVYHFVATCDKVVRVHVSARRANGGYRFQTRNTKFVDKVVRVHVCSGIGWRGVLQVSNS